MARQERAIRTRGMILEAMADLFNEVGYDAATIAALVERTGLTRGALYFHFTSKEDMARGVLAAAVTREGIQPQQFRVQEWIDLGLLLAWRLPREPMIRAAVRLSVDPGSRALFGTRWPDWIDVGRDLLAEAKERGELFPQVDPEFIARLMVGAWTGVQVVTEGLPDELDLAEEISGLYQLVLPNIVYPGVLAKLETSPHRAERLIELSRATQRALSVPVDGGGPPAT